ncbi:MAG: dihydroneopterin aldolase [Bacteroidota bacterium]|nr:dihydroneopterin aldolase [Bacteroidota bacterium]
MLIISLTDHKVWSKVGLNKIERKIGIELSVSVKISINQEVEEIEDIVIQTIDYSKVKDIIKQVNEFEYETLEYMIKRIYEDLCSSFEILTAVEIEICKNSPYMTGANRQSCVKMTNNLQKMI